MLTMLSALACVILYWASVPHWYGIEMCLAAFFIGVPLMMTYVIRFGLASHRGAVSGRLGRWLVPGFIVAGVVMALVADAPFWLRFTISKPSMEAYARTVTAETAGDFSCRWLGLYRICGAAPYNRWDNSQDVPGSAVLNGEEWAIYSNTHFVMLPQGRPEEVGDDTYRHLTGPWYGLHSWDNW
ncbi:hypothetical protein [Streptosporangium sp. NPDC051022]|uniref:hypothetical protein n=1 Tax=Streptosporangium sp. NPDC051022 TaxID=3155752 RepID=UPI0034404F61